MATLSHKELQAVWDGCVLTTKILFLANDAFVPYLLCVAGRSWGTNNVTQYLTGSRLGQKQARATAGAQKECKDRSHVLFAHHPSICSIAAIEIPSQIFSGKASLYFGNIDLAYSIEEKNVWEMFFKLVVTYWPFFSLQEEIFGAMWVLKWFGN